MKFTPLFIGSLFIVLIATLTPNTDQVTSSFLGEIPHFDKIVHFLIFAFLAYQSLKAVIDKEKIADVLLGCICLGLLTEVLQQFIPGRGMDIYDGIADTLGIVGAYYFYKKSVKNERV